MNLSQFSQLIEKIEQTRQIELSLFQEILQSADKDEIAFYLSVLSTLERNPLIHLDNVDIPHDEVKRGALYFIGLHVASHEEASGIATHLAGSDASTLRIAHELKSSLLALQKIASIEELLPPPQSPFGSNLCTKTYWGYLALALESIASNHQLPYAVSDRIFLCHFKEHGGILPGIWGLRADITVIPSTLRTLEEHFHQPHPKKLATLIQKGNALSFLEG